MTMNCSNCNKEAEYSELHTVSINENPFTYISYRPRKRPFGTYHLCDNCLGVTKKLKEVRQAPDPPIETPFGMLAKLKEFFSSKESGENNSY